MEHAISSVPLSITVRIARGFRVRLWIALRLIAVAAWVVGPAGVSVDVEQE